MIGQVKASYRRQLYRPTWWGVLINPYYLIRRGLAVAVAEMAPSVSGGRLLDFGCGSQPYRDLFDVETYVGLDIETSGHPHVDSKVDVYYDGRRIPFPDGHFDAVFSGEVVEHLFTVDDSLAEIARVLQPGGKLLVTVPFAWEEHEVPYDFARYSTYGLESLLARHGFVVERVIRTSGYVETVAQLWGAYVYHSLLPGPGPLRTLLTPLFIAPVSVGARLLSAVLPRNERMFLNQVVLATLRPVTGE